MPFVRGGRHKNLSTMFKKVLYLALAALPLAGCVNENLNDCPPAGGSGGVTGVEIVIPGAPEEHLETVELYVFDKDTGILKEIINVPKDQVASGNIDLNLPDGNYAVVLWGANNGNSLGDAGFEGVSGGGGIGAVKPTPGVTKLDDLREQLKTIPNPNTDGVAAVTPANPNFADLYESIGNVTVANGQSSPTTFQTKKMTADFQIILTGLSLPETFDYFIVGHNGIIKPDGTVDPSSPAIRYNPLTKQFEGDEATVDIKTMRFQVDDPNPMMLYIRYNGSDMIVPMNLTHLVTTAKDKDGNLLYNTQDKADAAGTFIITINVTEDSDLTVSVGDYRPSPLTPELETGQ